MPVQLGAAEILQVHEILSCAIDNINKFELYRPHVHDPQLGDILERQHRFALEEYDRMVNTVQNRGGWQGIPYRNINRGFTPKYGLRQPQPERPDVSVQSIDDRDVASGLLGLHKCSAKGRMAAALEAADPGIRTMFVEGAKTCEEQAYEVFQFMNQHGWYQVPTLKENTTQTMVGVHQPVGNVGVPETVGVRAPYPVR